MLFLEYFTLIPLVIRIHEAANLSRSKTCWTMRIYTFKAFTMFLIWTRPPTQPTRSTSHKLCTPTTNPQYTRGGGPKNQRGGGFSNLPLSPYTPQTNTQNHHMKNINHTHNRTSHAPINTHSNPPTQPTHKRGQLDWH